jgi:hypothetical protein
MEELTHISPGQREYGPSKKHRRRTEERVGKRKEKEGTEEGI